MVDAPHEGPDVQTKRSSDLTNWQRTNPVFAQNPAWIAQQVPGATDASATPRARA